MVSLYSLGVGCPPWPPWPAYPHIFEYPQAIRDGAGFPAGGVGRGHPGTVSRGGASNVTPRRQAKESYVISLLSHQWAMLRPARKPFAGRALGNETGRRAGARSIRPCRSRQGGRW